MDHPLQKFLRGRSCYTSFIIAAFLPRFNLERTRLPFKADGTS